MLRIVSVIKNPYKLLYFIVRNNNYLQKKISDKTYLGVAYRSVFGKRLDLNDPVTFNEKLQWLKLYDQRSDYTKMVDKYEAKKYVAEKIGEKHIIPTLGVWERFDEINFDELPNQFVLKCTHDSGGVVICKDKRYFDLDAAKIKIEKCLKHNFFYMGREWPYKNVKPRIIAEKYMKNSNKEYLNDYKFFCFNGVMQFYKIDFDRFVEHHANYYDAHDNILSFGEVICPPDKEHIITKPSSMDEMKKLAAELSKDIPFLRVDFYDVNGSIYFGELTFYPASGFGKFIPDSADLELGNLLNLDSIESK